MEAPDRLMRAACTCATTSTAVGKQLHRWTVSCTTTTGTRHSTLNRTHAEAMAGSCPSMPVMMENISDAAKSESVPDTDERKPDALEGEPMTSMDAVACMCRLQYETVPTRLSVRPSSAFSLAHESQQPAVEPVADGGP